jgi:hypothetical protein
MACAASAWRRLGLPGRAELLLPRAHLTEADVLPGAFAPLTESTASAPERPGSEPGAGPGPGLESASNSASDSESSEAREPAAAAAGEFDLAKRRAEVQAEWEARGLVRREAFSSRCFGVS